MTPRGGEGLPLLPSTKKSLRPPLQPSEPRELHKHAQCPNAGGKFVLRCWTTAAVPSKGCRLPEQGPSRWLQWGGVDSEWFSLSPAASASRRAAQLENWAASQEFLSYIPDAAINFLYGLGQLVSPASLGFSLDKVGKIVNIMDL